MFRMNNISQSILLSPVTSQIFQFFFLIQFFNYLPNKKINELVIFKRNFWIIFIAFFNEF